MKERAFRRFAEVAAAAVLLLSLPAAASTSNAVQNASLDARWTGYCIYDGDRYELTMSESNRREEPVIRLESRLLGSVELANYAVSGDRITFNFERSDTGLVEVTLNEQDGVARGDAYAGDQLLLKLCLMRDGEVDSALLQQHMGLYTLEDGAALLIHTEGDIETSLYASLFESTEVLPLRPVNGRRFLSDLQLEGEQLAAAEFNFDDGRLTFTRDGVTREGRRVDSTPTAPAKLIETEMQRLMKARDIPSLSVGLIHRDKLVYAKSFGFADRENEVEATPDTLYQLGSVAKPFTATIVAKLVELDVVDWDDPVEQHLPQGVRFESIDPDVASRITLRRLATHTSGLPRVSQLLRDAVAGPSVEEVHEAIASVRLARPVGSDAVYSNLGFGILGHAAEAAAGKSYEALLQEHIFEPLGMEASTADLDADVEARLAVHYWDEDEPRVPRPPYYFGQRPGSGALISNINDMAKFVSWQLGYGPDDERLIADDALFRVRVERQGLVPAWSVDSKPAQGMLISHGGESNGHSAQVTFSPADEVGVVVLANIGGNNIFDFSEWLMNTWIDERRRQSAPAISSAEHANWADRFGETVWSYRYLVDANPDDGQSWYRLGRGHFGLHQLDQAVPCFERALELDFEPGYASYMLARVAAARGDRDGAVTRLEQAVESGFGDAYRLRSATEFDGLRESDEFRALVDRMLE